jgi:hypothetical protein
MKINVYAELVEAKENDPIHGYTMEVDAFGFDAAIRDAAEKFYDNNDGNEWMHDGCTLYSVDPDGVIRSHNVTMDWSPNFLTDDGTVVE